MNCLVNRLLTPSHLKGIYPLRMPVNHITALMRAKKMSDMNPTTLYRQLLIEYAQ